MISIAELYEMVCEFFIKAVIQTILKKVLGFTILLVLCIDSKS